MPDKCCVVGCRSNYASKKSKTPYKSVFPFPKEEKRKALWLKKIQRQDYVVTQYSFVCIDHFSDYHIIRQDKYQRKDGSWVVIDRKKPSLTEDAFPSIFPKVDLNSLSKCPKGKQMRKSLAQGHPASAVQIEKKVNYSHNNPHDDKRSS